MAGCLTITNDDNLQNLSTFLGKRGGCWALLCSRRSCHWNSKHFAPPHPSSTAVIPHIIFAADLKRLAFVSLILVTLANLYSSIGDAPPPPPLPQLLVFPLIFQLESARSVLTSATLQDLCAPPSITFSCYLLLHSLEPEVEVTGTVTQSHGDKKAQRAEGAVQNARKGWTKQTWVFLRIALLVQRTIYIWLYID